MKNSTEIRQERAELIGKADALLNLAKDESRDFTNDEQVSYDGMIKNIDKLAKNIEVVERQEKLNAEAASIPVSHTTQKVEDSKEVREFSFIEAVNAAKSGRIEGLVKELDQEARRLNPNHNYKGVAIPQSVLESRGANTGLTAGSKPTDVRSFVEEMHFASVLVPAGANFYSGVSADQKIPIIDSVQVGFFAENGGSGATPAGTIENKTLSPKSCISSISVSNAAMQQNSSIEAAFRRSMARGVMSEMERQLLANGSGTGISSIFDSSFVGTQAGLTTWAASTAVANVNDAYAKLIKQGVRDADIKLFMNATAYSNLLTELAGEGGSAFASGSANLVDKTVLNIPYYVSQLVGGIGTGATTKARAFACDITKVHMALFGGLDLLVDPYSNSLYGGVNLVMSALVDGTLAGTANQQPAVSMIKA